MTIDELFLDDSDVFAPPQTVQNSVYDVVLFNNSSARCDSSNYSYYNRYVISSSNISVVCQVC